MGRKPTDLVYIREETKRRNTFRKRWEGARKKAEELHILTRARVRLMARFEGVLYVYNSSAESDVNNGVADNDHQQTQDDVNTSSVDDNGEEEDCGSENENVYENDENENGDEDDEEESDGDGDGDGDWDGNGEATFKPYQLNFSDFSSDLSFASRDAVVPQDLEWCFERKTLEQQQQTTAVTKVNYSELLTEDEVNGFLNF
ncbi:MADS-domain transcription factor [Selaginella moellendorffii]|uniref:MADS-domain transcription factor n=1 Tax=Selaginella moellendorffii TaxID=88036 RepID=D8S5G7_SELML|nr:MADS-domain transcription factor [Selaginella moellendorffii]